MTTEALATSKIKRGRVHKVAAMDVGIVEEVFKNALQLLVPEDAKQRTVFASLMPYMFVLRNKGCSWDQLTDLLNKCGFKLQPSTVRSYFGEMQQVHMDQCQQRMNEQILLLNEVKKQTKSVDISIITSQINGIMDKQRTAAATKVQALFGESCVSSGHAMHDTAPAQRNEPASPAHLKTAEPASPARQKTGAGLRPAPEQQEEQNSFAVLGPTTNILATGTPFFDLDGAPTIPVISAINPSTASQKSVQQKANETQKKPTFRCSPLSQGIKPLTPRPNVPAEIYQDGAVEHPAINGLMLTLAERLYGAALEFVNDDGEIHTESIHEKRFRVMWQKPVTPTPTTTSKNFTDIDRAFFKS
jgi:hypothetical protein